MDPFSDLEKFDEAKRIGHLEYLSTDLVEEWISDTDRRRVVVSLVGKLFESHLQGFACDGLHLDRRRRRAYFTPNNGGDRTIVWNSSSRKGIKRGVVKTRGAGFECEVCSILHRAIWR